MRTRPSSGNTLEAYRAAAKSAGTSGSPPGGLPVGGERVLHIDVGSGTNLVFSPNNVTELQGTTVQFSYNPKVSPASSHLWQCSI